MSQNKQDDDVNLICHRKRSHSSQIDMIIDIDCKVHYLKGMGIRGRVLVSRVAACMFLPVAEGKKTLD